MRSITFIILFLVFLIQSCQEKNDLKAELLFKEGTIKLKSNANEEALIQFRKALGLEVSDLLKATIYRNMSIAFQNVENIDSATYYSRKGYEVAPSDSYIFYMNRAEYNLLSNDVHTAIQDLKSAKALDPLQMEVYQTLCLIYSGEYGDAYFEPQLSEVCAKKSVKLSPSNTTKEQLGSIYFQNEKYVEAVKIFAELYSKEPTNKRFEFFLGQSLYFAGDERGGENHMKKAAERDEECKAMYHEIFEIGQNIDHE